MISTLHFAHSFLSPLFPKLALQPPKPLPACGHCRCPRKGDRHWRSHHQNQNFRPSQWWWRLRPIPLRLEKIWSFLLLIQKRKTWIYSNRWRIGQNHHHWDDRILPVLVVESSTLGHRRQLSAGDASGSKKNRQFVKVNLSNCVFQIFEHQTSKLTPNSSLQFPSIRQLNAPSKSCIDLLTMCVGKLLFFSNLWYCFQFPQN